MVKARFYARIAVLSLVSLLFVSCASQPSPAPAPTPSPVPAPTPSPAPSPPGTISPVSPEESRNIAERFVKNSPTFVFDGIPETLKLTETLILRCPSCWQFVFDLECRHAGYGNRTGQILAQVITPHRAVITVIEGKVTSALMDEKWDMLKQKLIGQ